MKLGVLSFICTLGILGFSIWNFHLDHPEELPNLFLTGSEKITPFFVGNIAQIFAIILMLYFYRQRMINAINTATQPIIDKLLDFKIDVSQNELCQYASKRIALSNLLIGALIFIWSIYYILIGLAEVEILSKTNSFFGIIRLFNIADSFILLLLSICFVASKEIDNFFTGLLEHKKLYTSILMVLFVIEVFGFVMDYSEDFNAYLTTAVGLISSLCFLSFFARLDSIFFPVNSFVILVLFLYGAFQFLYSLDITNLYSNREMPAISQTILYLGYTIKFLGKVFMAMIICSIHFRQRLVIYFSCLFHYRN